VTALPNGTEKTALQARLDAVQNIIDTATVVAAYRSDHAVVLALTEETVTISDKAGVQAALAVYELLK